MSRLAPLRISKHQSTLAPEAFLEEGLKPGRLSLLSSVKDPVGLPRVRKKWLASLVWVHCHEDLRWASCRKGMWQNWPRRLDLLQIPGIWDAPRLPPSVNVLSRGTPLKSWSGIEQPWHRVNAQSTCNTMLQLQRMRQIMLQMLQHVLIWILLECLPCSKNSLNSQSKNLS